MIVLGARSRGRSRTFLRARRAAELAELTTVPIVVAPLQSAATLADRQTVVDVVRTPRRRAVPRPRRD